MYTESNPWLVFCYCVDFTKTSQGLHRDHILLEKCSRGSIYQLLIKELLILYSYHKLL